MHAFLITGKTQEARGERARKLLEEYGAMEIIELPTPKAKHYIKDIRGLNHKLSLKSSDNTRPRGVILEDAHLLTTEAANSFLKTLEEPPGNTIIILTAPNQDLLPETIASRCTNIELGIANYELGEEKKKTAQDLLTKLLAAGIGERLKFIEALGTRQQALEFCIGQIYAVRKLLVGTLNSTKSAEPAKDRGYTDTYRCIPVNQLAALIDRIDQTRRDLEANVNVKLSLADLLLNYPEVSI